jgi:hypothetical protein
MPLLQDTRSFLEYLRQHKEVRDRIKAGRDKTTLYAGNVFAAAWREVQILQSKQPGTMETLHDVLSKLPAPPPGPGTLQSYAESLAQKERVVNGARSERVIWRALSGIFASNAEGKVWFYLGSEVAPDTKVFALTEVHVLKRNPRITSESQDMLAYFERCVRNRNAEMNAGFLPGA